MLFGLDELQLRWDELAVIGSTKGQNKAQKKNSHSLFHTHQHNHKHAERRLIVFGPQTHSAVNPQPIPPTLLAKLAA